MKIVDLPNPIEMLSYTFYCQQYALGTFFEYRDFINWIEEKNEYKKVPSPILESLKYLCYGITVIVIFSLGAGNFPIMYCYSDEFMEHSFLYKFAYANTSGYFAKFFYYSAFLFQTGTAIASGFGYNGRSEVDDSELVDIQTNPDRKGEHQWDKFIGVYVYDCETATSSNTFLNKWNYRVHVWLKYYISERLSGKDQRPKTSHYLITFMMSAFWHGFYPFYYVTFTFIIFASFAHKEVYNMWFLFRAVPSWIRTPFCIL